MADLGNIAVYGQWDGYIVAQESTTGIVQGASVLGAPEATALQQVGWVVGSPSLGIPTARALQQVAWAVGAPPLAPPEVLGRHLLMASVIGDGSIGRPEAVASLQFGWALLPHGSGMPAAIGLNGFQGHVLGIGTAGLPQAVAVNGYRVLANPLGALGAPQARLWGLPAAAVAIPPGVTHYFCLLTGAPDGLADLVLPISSFSVRHRPDAPSYYQITIPSYAYVSDLAARPNGEIVIWSEQAGVSEELARGDLGQVAIARGPESQSISISGNADRAELPHLTYVIPEALYVASSFSGDTRLRIAPRARIRPGDYVRYQDLNMAVGEVTWAVSVSAGGMAATMELVSIPVESGA